MRLLDLPHTTSFRLALLFLALFGTASLLLFGFLYWQTAGYLRSGVDDWLAREEAGVLAARPAELKRIVAEHAARDPGGRRLFALFDAAGNRIAGSRVALPSPLPPLERPFEQMVNRGDEPVPFRGVLHRLPGGGLLLVSQDVDALQEFRELLADAMTWGGLLVLVLGLAGAVVTGAGALRRIDAITGSIERIVNGDLSERLPARGRAGDLDRLSQVVNGMLDDIERLMHEVKGVSDNIAHDLRTPLTRLLAALERAQRRAAAGGGGESVAGGREHAGQGGEQVAAGEEQAAAIAEAIVETRAILATFNAMLRIAEVESGARRAGFTRLDLARVAADVTELYDPLAESKGLALTLEADAPGPAEMPGDPSLLFEALGNLLDNAVKFTPAGGRVAVRVLHGNHHIGIAVTDTGPGIPAGEREAVLRRFYRAEKSRHTPGSGLGLSLVAAVARLHGLRLEIEDAAPGCRVTLWREEGT